MVVTNSRWIGQGIQKQALLRSLRKPMTSNELLSKMLPICPHVRLRDISKMLSKLRQRGLVYCLTPNAVTGRLHFFTDEGRRIVGEEFGINVQPLPPGMDWEKYAFVARGLVRKLTLLEFSKKSKGVTVGKTTTEIRKGLRQVHPAGLNAVIRALHELSNHGIIQRIGLTLKRGRPIYLPTRTGERIIEQLSR